MHDSRRGVEARLEMVRARVVRPNLRRAVADLDVSAWSVPDAADGTVGEPVDVAAALSATYAPVSAGHGWGRPWGTTWFRVSGPVPPSVHGSRIEALLDIGFSGEGVGFQCEGLLWRVEAGGDRWVPWRGLHPANRHVDVAGDADSVEYLIEAAANPPIRVWPPDPNSDRTTASGQYGYRLGPCRLEVVETELVELETDLGVLVDLMGQLRPDDPRRSEIALALGRVCDLLDPAAPQSTAGAARAAVGGVLGRPATSSALRVSAIGHAHIDSAWLWPARETVRKCTRTFSNVLRLMEDDPEFRFACSQAVQYRWMEERHPSLFAEIRERVAEGRWVPVGGMWVEADGNLVGGEALVRQFVHGQRYFRDRFGVTCDEVWLPDVFGYPASMPQIYRLAGCERFITQKLSWNRTNRFPHHTFWWEGIDGSHVFTHFPPVDTYNAEIRAEELTRSVRNFTESGAATQILMPFGYGDGGGGPTRGMLARLARMRDLEGLPRIEIASPDDFFEAAMAEYPDAAVWVGELYFETHRGTYTSQARTKVGNRRSELLAREAELFACATDVALDDYPLAQLDELWKRILFAQFHDILPGSSIGWVHRETEADHTSIAAELEGLITASLTRHAARTATPLVANASPVRRDEVIVVDAAALEAAAPAIAAGLTQRVGPADVAVRVGAPPMGVGPLRVLAVDAAVRADERSLDNGVIAVGIGADGTIESIVDKATGRELLVAGGRGALVQLHRDEPLDFDAWDIEDYYRHCVIDVDDLESVDVVDAGPLLGSVRVVRRFGTSQIALTYRLRAGSARLDVHCAIDWHERRHLLKLAFPFDVQTTEVAREIQFGHVRTPIHTNTSWDTARFEVCAHRWIDLSEGGFGVAVLNDGRYGHDVTRGRSPDGARPTAVARVTLLKGAVYPDPRADIGRHEVTISVLAHRGGADRDRVVAEGYALNLPLRIVAPPLGMVRSSEPERALCVPVTVDHDAVIIEAVKAAEDGSGDLVVRLYESLGGRARTRVTFDREVRVRVVDLLEDERGDLPSCSYEIVGPDAVVLELHAFQIVTLRASAVAGQGGANV